MAKHNTTPQLWVRSPFPEPVFSSPVSLICDLLDHTVILNSSLNCIQDVVWLFVATVWLARLWFWCAAVLMSSSHNYHHSLLPTTYLTVDSVQLRFSDFSKRNNCLIWQWVLLIRKPLSQLQSPAKPTCQSWISTVLSILSKWIHFVASGTCFQCWVSISSNTNTAQGAMEHGWVHCLRRKWTSEIPKALN